MTGTRKIYLLDGNSLIFRAFFALPTDLATSKGVVTNATHGFAAMLVTLLRDHDPLGMAVAFDMSGPTFRDELVTEYKGTRPEVPELLVPQFKMVRDLLDALSIQRVEIAGFEADDILATWATQARDSGRNAVVVTGDRDSFQLVEDPLVEVMYTRRGLSDTVLYDEKGIEEKYGVPPSLYPLLASLRGDPSDNLPGVPGVGEKTAAKLIVSYGSLDGIYANLSDLSPKLRQNLTEFEDRVRLNSTVIPLVRDVELPVTLDDLGLGKWDVDEAAKLFADFELNSLWQRIKPLLGDGTPKQRSGAAIEHASVTEPGSDVETSAGEAGTCPAARKGTESGTDAAAGTADEVERAIDVTPRILASASEIETVLQELEQATTALAVAFDWTGEPGRSPLSGLVLAETGSTGEARSYWLYGDLISNQDVSAGLEKLLGPQGRGIVGHDVKDLMRILLGLGVDIAEVSFDTAVAAYLIDPSTSRYQLTDLAARYLDIELAGAQTPTGQLGLVEVGDGDDDSLGENPQQVAARALSRQALSASLLAVHLGSSLDALGMGDLYRNVELPLIRVLARMEVAGIAVDRELLKRISTELADECKRLEGELHKEAGVSFNVNSTQQLRKILYEDLGLTPGKKTKTGYSTDAQTLERLRGQHPIIELLLNYREVEKLRSTYGETLLAEVASDGRIHATFQQTVARTGRLSSDHPNLHNIPVRSEVGRRLRSAFIPAEGCKLLIADYDQIELRLIAHMSQDEELVTAFANGVDVHRATAARVFAVAPQDVTFTQRNRAKMVSYGLVYGMEAFGLAQRLGTSVPEAQQLLDGYFAAFPSVKASMEHTVTQARQKGYTETILGRRRPLPDLFSPNRGLRMAAERQAMNAGIQGSAADLFKVALVELDAGIDQQGLAARVVLQVHDEVIVEVGVPELETTAELVTTVLQGVGDKAGLSVPLKVSIAWGDSWSEAKS